MQIQQLLQIDIDNNEQRNKLCAEYGLVWELIEKAIEKIANTEITAQDIKEVASENHMLLKTARTKYTGRFRTQNYTYKGD